MDTFLRLLGIIAPILAVAGVGFVYGRQHRPDLRWFNRINMDVFVPALMFYALAGKEAHLRDYAPLALAGALIVLGSGVLAWPWCRWANVEWRTLVLPMMFNNSGNMGLPLLMLAFGEKALPAAVVLFVVETSLHFSVGVRLLDARTSWHGVLKMPVMLATFAGLVWGLSGVALPTPLAFSMKLLGEASIPVMLFSLGVRLNDIAWRDWRLGVLGGLLCPATGLIMAALIRQILPLPPTQQPILWVFAALPPAVLNYLLAEQYRQQPQQVAAIVLMGNVFSIFIIPPVLWWAL